VNLLEPWVLLRLIAGVVAAALFGRGAVTSFRVLRHFDLAHASEGQLALERQAQLSATFVRVATAAQVAALALTVLAADRLSRSVRGAMCAYGVFSANAWGFRALFMTIACALCAGILAQLYALDARVRGMDLMRPVAVGTLLVAPVALLDLVFTGLFLTKLDLGAVTSCCSVQLDEVASGATTYASGPRVLLTVGAMVAVVTSAFVAYLASRRPGAPLAALAGDCSLVALPLAVGAAVLETAPHAFEIPQHVCPFCLLRADVLFVGYPLFGAILLAVVWALGAALGGVLARGKSARDAFAAFARSRFRWGAVAWLIALAVGAAPVVRYAVISGGGALFQ